MNNKHPPLEDTLAQLDEALKESRKDLSVFDKLQADLMEAREQTRKKLPKVKPDPVLTRTQMIVRDWDGW